MRPGEGASRVEFSGLGFDPGSPIPPGESDSHSPRSGSPGKWVARVPESQDPGVQVHSRTEQRVDHASAGGTVPPMAGMPRGGTPPGASISWCVAGSGSRRGNCGQAGRSAPSLPAGSPECAQRRAHSRLKPLGRGISGRSVGSPAAARMLRMSSTVNGVDRFFWMTIVPSW